MTVYDMEYNDSNFPAVSSTGSGTTTLPVAISDARNAVTIPTYINSRWDVITLSKAYGLSSTARQFAITVDFLNTSLIGWYFKLIGGNLVETCGCIFKLAIISK